MLKNNQWNILNRKVINSGKKKCHTQKAQLIINKETQEIICTDFSNGNDFRLFKESQTVSSSSRATALKFA